MPNDQWTSHDRVMGAVDYALTASNEIIEWTDGWTLVDYLADPMMRSAIERQIGLLGASLIVAGRHDSGLQATIPGTDAIIEVRERLAHAYFETDNEVIWSAITTIVPPIRERLVKILDRDADAIQVQV